MQHSINIDQILNKEKGQDSDQQAKCRTSKKYKTNDFLGKITVITCCRTYLNKLTSLTHKDHLSNQLNWMTIRLQLKPSNQIVKLGSINMPAKAVKLLTLSTPAHKQIPSPRKILSKLPQKAKFGN
jgi:hypothetical protein